MLISSFVVFKNRRDFYSRFCGMLPPCQALTERALEDGQGVQWRTCPRGAHTPGGESEFLNVVTGVNTVPKGKAGSSKAWDWACSAGWEKAWCGQSSNQMRWTNSHCAQSPVWS